MLQTVLDANPADETTTARDTTLIAYRFMLKARVLDDKLAALYPARKIHGGVFLGPGQEALSASVRVSLQKNEVLAPFVCDDLADKAVGYGVASHAVDGTDLVACLKTIGAAVAKGRAGEGPQLVVANLLRLCGHGEHDDSNYIDPKLKNSPLGRDCLKVAEEYVLRQKWTDAATIA